MQHSANEFLKAWMNQRYGLAGGVTATADELGINQSLLRNFLADRAEAYWHQDFMQRAIEIAHDEIDQINSVLAMVPRK